jgi:hypothetical protein
LTDHSRTGCYSPLLRPDDLLNLQVDAQNLALETSDPQQPLLDFGERGACFFMTAGIAKQTRQTGGRT